MICNGTGSNEGNEWFDEACENIFEEKREEIQDDYLLALNKEDSVLVEFFEIWARKELKGFKEWELSLKK